MRTSTSSASRMDPSLETACLSSNGSPTGSLTDGEMIAQAPQGPGLGMHEPSVKTNVVSNGASIIRPIITYLPSISWPLVWYGILMIPVDSSIQGYLVALALL